VHFLLRVSIVVISSTIVEQPEDLKNEEEKKGVQQQRHPMPSAFDLIDSGSGVQTDVSLLFIVFFLLVNNPTSLKGTKKEFKEKENKSLD